MDAFRAYLLSDKNTSMLENIIIDKLYDTTGISINKRDPKFQQSMLLVITTIMKDELHLLKSFDKKALLKINNIFIKETVQYLADILSEQQEEDFTSKLSEEDETESFLYQEQKRQESPIQVSVPFTEHVQEPKVVKNIYFFDEKTTFLNIENVISMEMVNFTIDYSGYIVNKNNCNLCIDNVEYEIENGNYTAIELVNYLNNVTNVVLFSLDTKKDIISMSINKPQERKSMSASIKDRENPKQANVNFGVKNSVAKLLGYEEKTYIVKDEKPAENKHLVKHPSYIDISIKYSETCKEDHRIFFNCKYNETLHHTPLVGKKVTTLPITLKSITMETDYESNRPFCFSVKISTMLN